MSVIQYQCIHVRLSIICTADPIVVAGSLCLCVLSVCVSAHGHGVFSLAVGFLSGLQVLKSMRFNTSSNLTLSDIALKPWKWDWKDTEALFFPQSCGFMSLRWGQLSFHWSVMPQREKTKLPLKAFHLYLVYDFERPNFNVHPHSI